MKEEVVILGNSCYYYVLCEQLVSRMHIANAICSSVLHSMLVGEVL